LLEPIDFISIAEGTGLIAELSLMVMKQALSYARHWDSRLTIAVNISPLQLKDPLLAQRISKILVETGFPAHRLELEITESSFFENQELALSTIESMKNCGVTISLDDFGTGYASLTQLQALPFDRLKVDQSFVSSMIENEESAAIVSAIVNLGASLSLPVTAEGVETAAVEKSLKLLGCSDAQGWLFGKAASVEDIEIMLSQVNSKSSMPRLGGATALRPAKKPRRADSDVKRKRA
jgi:EAL domain-containing protein (putative c-di-GMP-specific phosphodiesterase class I)